MPMIEHLAPVNLVISSGEPAGIGPEVSSAAALAFLREQPDARITLLGDASVCKLPEVSDAILTRLMIEPIQLSVPVIAGQLNPANAQYVLNMLNAGIDGCLDGRFDALVTAPLQKSVINDAGAAVATLFTGHTEYLARRCGVDHVVMMLCAILPTGFLSLQKDAHIRVALATTHLPLKDVPATLNQAYILETIQIVNQDLRNRFGIAKPIIRVAGLNPHAGESGYLGRDEIGVIRPALGILKNKGIDVQGPLPADTMFTNNDKFGCDAYVAMYHDQGLPVLKFAGFGESVNVTLGLPIIRTSVDHGTALELAGKNSADCASLLAAVKMAMDMAMIRNHQ